MKVLHHVPARLIVLMSAWLMSVPTYALAPIERWQTSNGMTVLFVAAPELPMVDFSMLFHAGSARDADQLGLSMITNALITDGTSTLSADQVAQGFESVGAEFYASTSRDGAVIGLRSLTDLDLLDPAIMLVQQVLSAPAFPEPGFQRVRQQMLVALKAKQQSPGDIAGLELMSALYPEHPYGSPKEGTEDSLMTLKPQHLQDFYQQYYVAKNGVLAIVGDLSLEQAKRHAEQLTKGLKAGVSAPDLNVPVAPKAQKIQVNFPSSQTHVFVAQLGMAVNDADYFPLYVGNHVLGGGGFVSRLMEEVRSKRGLSYSVYSYFQPMQQTGPFIIGLQTKNEQVTEAQEAVRETLENFLNHGPTEKELRASIQNITGGFPLRLDSNRKIVDYLAQIGFYELPMDYLDTFNEQVEAVTVEAVKGAFQRLNADNMLMVTVGGSAQ